MEASGQERGRRRGPEGAGGHRLLLLGCAGPLAAGVLQGAAAAGFGIAEAWTGLPAQAAVRRRDRRLRWTAPHWSTACLLARHGAPIRRIPALAGWVESVAAAKASGADILISAGFMQRVPAALIDAFPGRVFNIHPALLPRRRGPDPVLAALLEGTIDADGGVTLHVMSEGFDEGDIVAQRLVPFDRARPHAYGFALASAAGRLVAADLPRYLAGDLSAVPQDAALATAARVDRAQISLGRHLTVARAAALVAGIGLVRPITLATPGGGPAVQGCPQRLGPPTGAPPATGAFHIEVDLADARVRFRRRSRADRWMATVRRQFEAFVADRVAPMV